mgnify:CR=1 FL=1
MQIKASLRDLSKTVNALRREGLVPAELYGPGITNQHLVVTLKELQAALKEAGESSVITLELAGKKYPVRIQDIQRDTFGLDIHHADFRLVKMDQKTKVRVILKFVGNAPAAKAGYIINHGMSEIEVEGLPGDIPNHIEVDVSSLTQPGDFLHAGSLRLPKGVSLITAPESIIASVVEFQEEPVEEVAETSAAGELPVETVEQKESLESEK